MLSLTEGWMTRAIGSEERPWWVSVAQKATLGSG